MIYRIPLTGVGASVLKMSPVQVASTNLPTSLRFAGLQNFPAYFQMESQGQGEVSSPETLAFMELAIEQARHALDCLEVPVGCVIAESGKVIASGRNRTTETRNATRHAEMEAIDVLLEQWQKTGLSVSEVAEKFSKCTLYVTCEPCIMCAAALSILGIKEVYYGCANDKFGGCGSILSLHSSSNQPYDRLTWLTENSVFLFDGFILVEFEIVTVVITQIVQFLMQGRAINGGEVAQGKEFKCTGGIMASEAVSLLRCFYEQGNPNAPKPHRPVILQATHQ